MNSITFPIRPANPLRLALRWFKPRTEERLVLRPAMPSVPGLTAMEKRVLIVDDDAIILKTLSLKLEAFGYGVSTAMDGPAAIHAVREQKPDLILLDLNLPPDVGAVAWDGYLLMSWLRRLPETRDIPVIIITGGEPARNKDRSMSSGAVAFFHKPIDHHGLMSVIEQAVRHDENAPSAPISVDFQV